MTAGRGRVAAAGLLVAALLLGGCAEDGVSVTTDPLPPTELSRVDTFDIVRLGDSVPWYGSTTRATFDDYLADEEGVLLWAGPDGEYHYHPVEMAQKGLALVALHARTGDARPLDYAERHARRLLLEADTLDGGLYFPYTFDWRLHLQPFYELMRAPWYSGMAQGQVLSLLVRLYRVTGEEGYRKAADRVFATFQRTGAEGETARIDTAGYYWIEEYPAERSTGTLNGFIFGIYGLYEYYDLTGDDDALRLLRASLTTIADHIALYRVKGGISYYCLSHRARYERYHRIHIVQLQNLFRITGHAYFDEMAALFAADA